MKKILLLSLTFFIIVFITLEFSNKISTFRQDNIIPLTPKVTPAIETNNLRVYAPPSPYYLPHIEQGRLYIQKMFPGEENSTKDIYLILPEISDVLEADYVRYQDGHLNGAKLTIGESLFELGGPKFTLMGCVINEYMNDSYFDEVLHLETGYNVRFQTCIENDDIVGLFVWEKNERNIPSFVISKKSTEGEFLGISKEEREMWKEMIIDTQIVELQN